jgi:hypothetical protein
MRKARICQINRVRWVTIRLRIYLGEQVGFWFTVAQLDRALFIPEAAV